jgi:hypothetical protein
MAILLKRPVYIPAEPASPHMFLVLSLLVIFISVLLASDNAKEILRSNNDEIKKSPWGNLNEMGKGRASKSRARQQEES